MTELYPSLDEIIETLNSVISGPNISDAEAIEMSKVGYLGSIARSLDRVAFYLERE